MWFFHYYSFKLLHKSHTLFSLKPPFSNLTFIYSWEVVGHHLHSLPQHHQSHLHLACLFTSHLCHLLDILPQIPLSGIMFLLIQIPMILKCFPYITWLEFLEDPEQFLVMLLSIDKCHWTISMFILNKTYLETTQTTLAWSLTSVSRTYCLWLLVSLPHSMTFHPQPELMQPFLVSSDTIFFYHPSTYFNSLEALVSWPNGFSYISSNCLLIYVVYWGHTHLWWPQNIPYLLAIAGNLLYQTQLNSASSSWSCLICCFCSSFIPTYCVSTMTFCKGGAMS